MRTARAGVARLSDAALDADRRLAGAASARADAAGRAERSTWPRSCAGGWSSGSSALDAMLADALALPGGRAAIDYLQPVPLAAARAQAFYGLTATPVLAGGSVELRLALLSPAGRPIAITGDLAGFWRGGWADARRDMRGRYPRHDWPEDPRCAARATLLAGNLTALFRMRNATCNGASPSGVRHVMRARPAALRRRAGLLLAAGWRYVPAPPARPRRGWARTASRRWSSGCCRRW